MYQIIVATDHSPLAENAVNFAAALAKEQHAKLILFNSFELPVHAANTLLTAHAFQEIIDENSARLKKRAEAIGEKMNIETACECIYSSVGDELTKLISKHRADLIVLGMPEKSLEQSLWGNTTTSAIKKIKFPILAVPLGASYNGFKSVLFACDDIENVPRAIFRRINYFAAAMETKIEFFHVAERVEDIKHKNGAAGTFASQDNDGIMYFYKNVRSNTVIMEIENEIIKSAADLLIMVPREHGFWESFVHRSKTRIMAAGLEIPLLSIPL